MKQKKLIPISINVEKNSISDKNSVTTIDSPLKHSVRSLSPSSKFLDNTFHSP